MEHVKERVRREEEMIEWCVAMIAWDGPGGVQQSDRSRRLWRTMSVVCPSRGGDQQVTGRS